MKPLHQLLLTASPLAASAATINSTYLRFLSHFSLPYHITSSHSRRISLPLTSNSNIQPSLHKRQTSRHKPNLLEPQPQSLFYHHIQKPKPNRLPPLPLLDPPRKYRARDPSTSQHHRLHAPGLRDMLDDFE